MAVLLAGLLAAPAAAAPRHHPAPSAAPTAAPTAGPWDGTWQDLDPAATRIGAITIRPHRVSIAGFATWTVGPADPFGDGAIVRVQSVQPHTDPAGCGPTGAVTYIVIRPQPMEPVLHRHGIAVIFYGGLERPTPAGLATDPGVCEIHPFSRPG